MKMKPSVGPVERAFQIASSGKAESIDDICKQLRGEGYSTEHIFGRYLLAQLRSSLRSANGETLSPK